MDIGANRAQNSLLISKKFRINEIILIEPNNQMHKFIHQSLKNFNYKILDECVTNYDGYIKLYISNFDLTSSTIKHNPHSEYYKIKTKILGKNYSLEPITKKCRTLQSIIKDQQINYIDYLKIDVEGAELYVLQGAHFLMKNSRIGIIQLEIHKNGMRQDYTEEILNLLQSCNYNLYKIVKHSFGNISELIFISKKVEMLLSNESN